MSKLNLFTMNAAINENNKRVADALEAMKEGLALAPRLTVIVNAAIDGLRDEAGVEDGNADETNGE